MAAALNSGEQVKPGGSDELRVKKGHPLNPPKDLANTDVVRGDGAKFDSVTLRSRASLTALDARGRNPRGGESPASEVDISRESAAILGNFARDYVQRLLDLQKQMTTVNVGGVMTTMTKYEDLGRLHGLRPEDTEMLRLFTTIDPNDPNRVNSLLGKDAVGELIRGHDKIHRIIEEVMVIDARDRLAAMGLRARMVQPGNRTNPNRLEESYHLPTDEGVVNAAWNKLTHHMDSRLQRGRRDVPEWSNLQATAGVLGVGALGAAGAELAVAALAGVVAPPIGAAAGILAVGPAISATIARITRNGPKLEFVEDTHALARMQHADEATRADYLYGINPNDRAASNKLGITRDTVVQEIYARWILATESGVPMQALDALPDEFIYEGNPDLRPEETWDKMGDRIYADFKRDGGRTAATVEARREIWRKTQRDVLISECAEYLEETTRVTPDDAKRIKAAIEGRGENGAITLAKKKNAETERTALGVDKNGLTRTATTITAYQDKLRAVRTPSEELDLELRKIIRGGATLSYQDAMAALRGALVAPVAVGGVAPVFAPMQITDAHGDIVPIGNFINVADEALKATIRGEQAAIPAQGAMGPETNLQYTTRYNGAIERINNLHVSEAKVITDQRNAINEAIRLLQDKHDLVATASKAATPSQEATSAEARAGVGALTELHDAYERVRTILTPAGAAAPVAVNLDFATLMHDINGAGVNGWPEDENNLELNRQLVHRAIVQQRTINRLHDVAFVPTNAVLEPAFVNITATVPPGRRINTEQLRAMSIDQLIQRDRELAGPGGAPTPQADLQRAKEWAEQQVEQAQASIQEENRLIDTATVAQDRLIRNANPELERAQLQMILAMVESRDSMPGRAVQEFRNNRPALENVGRVVVAAAAVPTDVEIRAAKAEGYTDAEISSNLPRNILEMINVLTNYQNDPAHPDRNGEFQKIWTNLGGNTIAPERLFGILENSLGRRLNPAVRPARAGARWVAPRTLDVFAQRLSNTVHANDIDAFTLGQSTFGIVREFNTWSKSI